MSRLKWLDQWPILQCTGISIILNLMVEMFSRRSFLAGLEFMLSEPMLFLYNAAIIMLTLSFSLVFKRRYFALIIISAMWIALGVVNCVLLGFRTTPLAAIDFQLLQSVDGVISMYLNIIQIISIIAALSIVIAGMVLAWIRTPKSKPMYLKAVTAILVVIISIASSTSFLVRAQTLSSNFGNLADAYKDYGFAYCFSRSLIDRGIDEPEGYSEEKIAEILTAIRAGETRTPESKPNIIMVQLESFFDVNYLENLNFSENPVPAFTALKESYPHGFLTVPTIGAGTANTEFEVLTGISLDYFGAGEYPYKTVLQDGTTESISYNLAELGYINHAIHNHEGTFYKRHVVFSNLGFDTFTSIEYMNDVEYNQVGWAKDEVLSGEIMKALGSTEGQDFVYAISVQPHGRFPKEIDATLQIKVTGFEEDEERAAFEYFVNQLNETDAFINALVAELSTFQEPVALVLFGDHLPGMNIDNKDLANRDRFETEYVIWNNFGLETENQDLSTYQLSAYVLDHLGINNGILTKLHQTLSNHEDYQAALEMLEYDMVCGEQYVYGSDGPHAPTALRMGISDIVITGTQTGDGVMYVTGQGFTEWSQVFIDDKKIDTEFIDGNSLMIPVENLEPGTKIAVAQIGDNTVLSETKSYISP